MPHKIKRCFDKASFNFTMESRMKSENNNLHFKINFHGKIQIKNAENVADYKIKLCF